MKRLSVLRQSMLALLFLSFSSLGWAAININTADQNTIDKELAGVGPKMAAAIVKERQKAPFTSLDDVDKRVKGWGKKTSEKNKDKVKFNDK